MRDRVDAVSIAGALLFGVFGLLLVVGGAWLMSLGGSLYYLLSGVALLVVAALILKRSRSAFTLYAAFCVATVVWSLFEVGFDTWALLPRIALPIALSAWFALPFVWRRLDKTVALWGRPEPRVHWVVSPILIAIAAALLIGSFYFNRFEPLGIETAREGLPAGEQSATV